MRIGLLLSFGLIVLVGFSSCSREENRSAIDLILEVETPSGLKSGSSTIQFIYHSIPKWLPNGGGTSIQTNGDAVAVDLGNQRRLYALLNAGGRGREVSWLSQPIRLADDGTIADPSLLPMLVTFNDESDPSSIVEVPANDLSAAFGPGYRLRRIRAIPSTGQATRAALDAIPLFRDIIFKMSMEQPVGGSGDGPQNRPFVTRLAFRQGKE